LGAPLIEHCMTVANFPEKNVIGKNFEIDKGNVLSKDEILLE